MKKKFYKFLGVSVLPALLVMPAMALELDLYDEARIEDGVYENAPNRYFWVNPEATVNVGAGAVFRNNQRTTAGGKPDGNGGAAVVEDDTATLILNGTAANNVVFDTNHSEWNAGGIMNAGTLKIYHSKFENNYVTGSLDEHDEPTYKFVKDETLQNANGGAICNYGITDIYNSSFIGNKAGDAGAIYNSGTLTVKDSKFDSNYAKSGGGAILQPFDVANTIVVEKSIFSGNAAGYAAAIGAYNKLEVTDSKFINNIALDIDNNGGGAIMAGGHGKLNITGSTFSGNTANAGGAISTRPRGANAMGDISTSEANKDGHWLVIQGSDFYGNISGVDKDGNDISGTTVVYGRNSMITGDGGAIWHGFEGTTVGGVEHKNIISGSTFADNIAKRNGGAVYNEGNLDIISTTFKNNIAAVQGGAIYNYSDGQINLTGENKFSGNKAGDVVNDIHNLGTLNIVSGTTTTDGGITGTGILNIEKDATLNIGKSTITQDKINLGGTLIAELVDDADYIFNVATEFKDEGGKLSLAIEKAGTYNLFANAKFDKAQKQVTSTIFDLDWDSEDRSFTATKKSVEDIAGQNHIEKDVAATLSVIADAASNSSSQQMKDLSVKLQEKLAGGDAEAVEHATKAINPEKESVAQAVTSSVQNTVVGLASARMSLPAAGRSGGDVNFTSGGVWAQGVYNRTKQANAFNGYTRGIAAGLDGTINKHWTVGAGYSFAHSDISGSARDTDIDSNTLFLYGQYKPSEWYLNAVANYTMSNYSEHGTVIDDTAVAADYKVKSFGANVATGYDFESGITPELGLRYMHVSTDDYANSYGIKTHMNKTNYLTGLLGAKYSFDVVASEHTVFMPQLSAGFKYDLVSDGSVATVTMPGISAYSLEGSRLSRAGGEFGIGLGLRHRNLDLSVNYDIDVRQDYTSQTGMLKLRCNF